MDYLALHGCYSLATADFDTSYYEEAKNRIEEIGQWGLMPRWEQVKSIEPSNK